MEGKAVVGNDLEQVKLERLKLKHERWQLKQKTKLYWRIYMLAASGSFASLGSVMSDPNAVNGAFMASGLFGIAIALTIK